MVGLLPPGRRTPEHLRTGRLDMPTYAALLLGTLARLAGKAAQATPSGVKGTPAEGGPPLQRSVAFGRHRQPAHRTTQRNPTPTRLPIAIRLGRYHVTERLCSIAGCEKRTSGGVGGCRGAILGTRPDHHRGLRRYWIERADSLEGISRAALGASAEQAQHKRGASVLPRYCSGIAPVLRACCSLGHPLYIPCTSLLHHLGLRVCFGRCLKPSAPRLAPPKPATARTALTLSRRTQRCH